MRERACIAARSSGYMNIVYAKVARRESWTPPATELTNKQSTGQRLDPVKMSLEPLYDTYKNNPELQQSKARRPHEGHGP